MSSVTYNAPDLSTTVQTPQAPYTAAKPPAPTLGELLAELAEICVQAEAAATARQAGPTTDAAQAADKFHSYLDIAVKRARHWLQAEIDPQAETRSKDIRRDSLMEALRLVGEAVRTWSDTPGLDSLTCYHINGYQATLADIGRNIRAIRRGKASDE